MKYAFMVHIARNEDLQRIISFLSQPEIDKGFCKPLSERNISISDRVLLKYKQGVWIIAEIENQIVSCIAIVPVGEGVSFSTFACMNERECKLAGGGVWNESLKLVKEMSDVSFIEIDSWEGNEFINRFLRKRGFKKTKTYPDPEKRPDCVKSVHYRMMLRSLN